MKIYLTILTVFLLFSSIYGQKQVPLSDAKFDALRGKVKTVRYHSLIYNTDGNPKKNENQVYAVTSYDKDGNENGYFGYINALPTVKTTYWFADGFNYRKTTKLNEVPSSLKDPPIMAKPSGSEKPLPIDSSFDLKLKHVFDEKGLRTETFYYGNDGRFLHKKVYEYDKNRDKIKETVFKDIQGGFFNDSSVFVYDSKGNIQQETVYLGTGSGKESDARIFHKYTFVYARFDEKGNWLEKKVLDSVIYGSPKPNPKLIRIEYQEITYHK